MASGTSWKDGIRSWSDATRWTNGVPAYGSIVSISGSSFVTLRGMDLLNEAVYLREASGHTGLIFINSSIGFNTTLDFGGYGAPLALTMQGNDTNNGTVHVSSDALDLSVKAGASLVNNHNMTVSSADGSAILFLNDSGAFWNKGNIIAGSGGSVDINFGYASSPDLSNNGLLEAAHGGNVMITASRSAEYTGTLNNSGLLLTAGTMTLNTDVAQVGNGRIAVENGGTLAVDGRISGGTVRITSASLQHVSTMNFGLMAPDSGVPSAGSQFQAGLVLSGAAELIFGGARVQALTYDAYAHELIVHAAGTDGNIHQVGDFHLTGPTQYSDSNFSVTSDGQAILFLDRSHLAA